MFEQKLTFIIKDKEFRDKFEPIIFYEEPLMFVNSTGEVLLYFYDSHIMHLIVTEWVVIYNSKLILRYIQNRISLRKLLLSKHSRVFYAESVDEENFFVERKIGKDELQNSFVLPKEDSYLRNLYMFKNKSQKFIRAKRFRRKRLKCFDRIQDILSYKVG